MVLFDSTYLILVLQPNSAPAKYPNGDIVVDGVARVDYLLKRLAAGAAADVICVPANVIAEVMVLGGRGGTKYLNEMKRSSRFFLAPFDVMAAVEAWELIANIKKEQRDQKWATWAKVKFDCQIAAIAKCQAVTHIYSDDGHIASYGERLNIPVTRVCDLELPPAPETNAQPTQETRGLFEQLDETSIG